MKIIPSLPIALFSTILCLGPSSDARDYWVSPDGSGAKDGSSQENRANANAVQKLLDQLEPGDRLILGSGSYPKLKLVVKKSGTAEKPIAIIGQGKSGIPSLDSDWTIGSARKGPTAIFLEPGVSHVVFHDLAIRGYQFGIQAPLREGAPPRSGLVFKNVDMQQIRHGFYLSACSDLKFDDCDLKSYSKHGFRFESACSNVTLKNCSADCTGGDPNWEKYTEEFPFGYIVNDGGAPNTNFLFEDCKAFNNLMPLQKTRYKNGDGFVVEGNSENVVFRRCIAMNNQDGGFDLKVKDVQLEGCVAMYNKRDFRIWTTGQLTTCYAGWSQVGIWTKGGPVVAERCTIAGWKSAPVEAEDAPVGIELRKCLLAADGTSKKVGALKAITLVDSIETDDLESAGLIRQTTDKASLSALGSSKHHDKGYHLSPQ